MIDNPYVDVEAAERIVGNAEFTAAGEDAQRRAVTVLTNHDALLPLTGAPKLYLQGVRPEAAAAYGQIVTDPAEADLAVVRLATPYEERPNKFESFFHSGDLAFPPPAELAPPIDLMKVVPTLVCVNLDRAAVLPEIADHAAALLADFGASDTALLDVAFGRATSQGRLPFELPRSMAAAASREDVPNDTEGPVFPAGHGPTI